MVYCEKVKNQGGKIMKTNIYNAAGGNATAINFGEKIDRGDFGRINDDLQARFSDVEQVAFYEEQDGVPLLQMAGGEFCGNATRSFACLLQELNPERTEFEFFVSGFPGKVTATVKPLGNNRFFCEAIFKGMKGEVRQEEINGVSFIVVDLGGIKHIIVSEDDVSFDKSTYEFKMKEIKDSLGVNCEAVGVLWTKEQDGKIFMNPVVWVKSINTCYYETSCGSGSIAIGLAMQKDVEVVQPSGKEIKVAFNDNAIVLSSEMEKIMQL